MSVQRNTGRGLAGTLVENKKLYRRRGRGGGLSQVIKEHSEDKRGKGTYDQGKEGGIKLYLKKRVGVEEGIGRQG